MATGNYVGDPYLLEDSDQESLSDSEDEINQICDNLVQETKSKHSRNTQRKAESSEDEFEKEMSAELDCKVESLLPQFKNKTSEQEANDALFYDPKMDDDDQRWVDQQRESYLPPSKNSKSHKTDAVLNCPACMCAVCLDCQRHEIYHNQYRAMFTINTVVDYGETLQFKVKQNKTKGKRKRKLDSLPADAQSNNYNDLEQVKPDQMNQSDDVDYFHPVNCSNCNTRIAVYDADEVYHFFNVLSSYS